MKIEITGGRCITCERYTQYYHNHHKRGFEAIDCGYCGRWQQTVRPGDRCQNYVEASNIFSVRRQDRGNEAACLAAGTRRERSICQN